MDQDTLIKLAEAALTGGVLLLQWSLKRNIAESDKRAAGMEQGVKELHEQLLEVGSKLNQLSTSIALTASEIAGVKRDLAKTDERVEGLSKYWREEFRLEQSRINGELRHVEEGTNERVERAMRDVLEMVSELKKRG